MAHLVKIGNSQGIRIPKSLVEQAHLEGHELKLHIVKDGLLVSPNKKPREGWEEKIKTISSSHPEENDNEWLDASLTNDEDIVW